MSLDSHCQPWSLSIKVGSDFGSWRLALIIELDRWSWPLTLTVNADRWLWTSTLTVDFDCWLWSLNSSFCSPICDLKLRIRLLTKIPAQIFTWFLTRLLAQPQPNIWRDFWSKFHSQFFTTSYSQSLREFTQSTISSLSCQELVIVVRMSLYY